jgi:hypothetical protein
MSLKPKRRLMGCCDDQVLLYAALFLACASVSSFGGGALGLALFLTLALACPLLSPKLPGVTDTAQESR